jgi:hypothetical protein
VSIVTSSTFGRLARGASLREEQALPPRPKTSGRAAAAARRGETNEVIEASTIRQAQGPFQDIIQEK